ncbi:chorismate mutase [Nocardioides ginsengisegetis]|uniref:Chorismate mutase n=1 Tax=Nocardioides ginsengisegetis TaxID=661491 RepID=A0A7W3IZR2_9ACTN|nr:gas vesicle protein GvpG [Nocardioides ginsengisegetis]MBA8803646.1 chorismate mutase [Nocardioides ginsengisegetis]
MGLITGLLTLPLAPVRGTVWVAEQVRREAERQYYDPARIRRELEDVDELRRSGDLTEEEAEVLEDELVERLMESRRRDTAPKGP